MTPDATTAAIARQLAQFPGEELRLTVYTEGKSSFSVEGLAEEVRYEVRDSLLWLYEDDWVGAIDPGSITKLCVSSVTRRWPDLAAERVARRLKAKGVPRGAVSLPPATGGELSLA